jgi:hypothetical protein
MKSLAVLGALLVSVPLTAVGQDNSSSGRWTQKFQPGQQGSRNIKLMSHIPLGGRLTVGDIEAEQELSRPYVYVGRMHGASHDAGFSIVSLKDPSRAKLLYTWRIENPDLHVGTGGLQNKYFKLKGRYYDVQSLQFGVSGPDGDLGAVVTDVTGLPDTSTIKIISRIRHKEPGGFHNVFTYKHSDGRVLMFTTTTSTYSQVYDMAKVVSGDSAGAIVGQVPGSEPAASPYGILKGYHDFYVGYDAASKRDLFYGAGFSSYYVYDVTDPASPKLVTTITGCAGCEVDHTFTPTPDGRYAVAEAEYQFAPLRIFDLKPGLEGTVKAISRPIGAWQSDWRDLPHNHEMRWPYVFVSGYEDGLQVFNMMDPTNPYTVGYYYTYDGPHETGYGSGPRFGGGTVFNGAFGVEVRNADGMIFISDMTTGFWAFKMEGFDGWNGHQWGMPNQSSAQDWDNGPDGAPKPQKTT